MVGFSSHARVVIIGGGAVGVSALYHLARAGWNESVLLEKNELTAGSTWHAAGNVPTFSTNWAIMNMQRYSSQLYRNLAAAVDYPMNYHVTGSLRLGHTKQRIQEFEHARSMGRSQGMDIGMLSPSEAREMYPFLELHNLCGVLYDPCDGDIDPAQLTQALAKGARNLGARIERFCPAIGISHFGGLNGEWVVHTPQGDIHCEIVVNAAGYYAGRVGEWFRPYGGRRVPMMVMSHQYLLSENIPEIAEFTHQKGHKLPLLRDVDSSYYLRQENTGLNLGPYENTCQAHWVKADDPMPDDFSFQLYPNDLERIEWHINDAMARVPLLGTAGISKVINGPIPYTPDGLPLLGPMPGVKNAFEACVFTFGIAQAGGAGKVLAEWVIEGQTEWDMWSVDPRRYTNYTDENYCRAKGLEVYGNEYAVHFPYHEWSAGRDKKCSPVHDKVVALGGVMGVYNGWERVNWFAKEGDDISEKATQTWTRQGPWQARIRAECEAVRDGVGVLDLPGFSRYNITGAGADKWLLNRITGYLPNVGRLNLAYFSDKRGRIMSEMSIFCHSNEHYTLITAATAQWHDFELLMVDLPAHLRLSDHSDQYSTLIVTGPKSRQVFTAISNVDTSLPWLSHQVATVNGVTCALARVSFAGELGWEIHAKNADIPMLYEAVLAQGATPFGMYALNSLRVEKGYRSWKGDLSSDYTLLEAGLDRSVKLDKAQDFSGKAALLREKQHGCRQAFVILTVDSPKYDAPYMSTLWYEDTRVGAVTSAAWGYRVNKAIALGMVRIDCAVAGFELELEIFGQRYKAIVQEDKPLWDANNARLKS